VTNSKSWNAVEEDDKVWGIFFPHCTENLGDYLNLEGSNEDRPEIGSSAQIEVTTQRDETKDMGTLETSEALVENIPLPVAPTKMSTLEVPPATEAAATEHITTIEHDSIETPQGEVAESELNITTSTLEGNDYCIWNSAYIFYIYF